MTRRRLLVLGASGRVGRLLSPAWREATDLDVVEQFRQDGPSGALIWPDLSDPAPFLDLCARHGPPDAILVLSGSVGGDPEALATNVRVARAAVDAAHLADVERVFLSSSSAVYGLDRGNPFREEDALDPVNAYGQSKIEMEAVRGGKGGPRITRLRIGNVVGADALLTAARRARTEAPLRLDQYPDGAGPRRSYISPRAFARAIASLSGAAAVPDVLNFAAPGPVAMADLLDAVGALWTWTPAPDPRTQSLVLDVSRLAAIHSFDTQDREPAHMVAHLTEPRNWL